MKMLSVCTLVLMNMVSLSGWSQSLVNQMSTKMETPESLDVPVGEYQQPQWTTQRSFGASRTYLIPKNSIEAEFWVRTKTSRDTNEIEYLYQQEIEYGFARHWQFDFYVNQIQQPNENIKFEGVQLELRYAFGDWNQFLLNPTLYFEYHPKQVGTDAAEVRLLLAEDLAPKWHFSSNLAYEVELFNEETREYAITAGISRSVLRLLAVGLEAKTTWTDTKDNRWNMVNEAYLGPSIQWQPTLNSHVDLVILGGLNNDSHSSEGLLIVGLDI